MKNQLTINHTNNHQGANLIKFHAINNQLTQRTKDNWKPRIEYEIKNRVSQSEYQIELQSLELNERV